MDFANSRTLFLSMEQKRYYERKACLALTITDITTYLRLPIAKPLKKVNYEQNNNELSGETQKRQS
jgi:hypothetical protein